MLAAAAPQPQKAPGPSLASVLTPAALQERLPALSDPADLAELAQQLPQAQQGSTDLLQARPGVLLVLTRRLFDHWLPCRLCRGRWRVCPCGSR